MLTEEEKLHPPHPVDWETLEILRNQFGKNSYYFVAFLDFVTIYDIFGEILYYKYNSIKLCAVMIKLLQICDPFIVY